MESRLTVAGTAPVFHRIPFSRPRWRRTLRGRHRMNGGKSKAEKPIRSRPLRRTLRQYTNLQQPVEVFDRAKQACGSPSKCSMGPNKPAAPRRSVRRGQTSLRQPVEVFDGPKQACGSPSKCSTGPNKSATARRSVRRGMRAKKAPSKCSMRRSQKQRL